MANRPDLAKRNREQHKGQFLYEDADWMRDAYLTRQRSIRQMAREANCGMRTIARWMTIHGIPARSMSEGRRLNPRAGAEAPQWIGGPSTCPVCEGGPTYHRTRKTCMGCRDRSGENNPKWRGDVVNYPAAHDRVKAQRGSASSYLCDHCGSCDAAHWAYDHADPNEKRDPAEGPYSLDIKHYLPLCVRCHKRFDMDFRREQATCTNIVQPSAA